MSSRIVNADPDRFIRAKSNTPENSDLGSSDSEKEDSVLEDQPSPVAKNEIKTKKITSEQQRIPEAQTELMQEYLKTIQERDAQKKIEDENKKLTDATRNAEREKIAAEIKKKTEAEKRRNEEEKRRKEEEQRRKAAKQKEIEDAQAVTNAVYANAAQDVKRSVSRDSVTSLGNVTQNNGNQTNNANLLKIYANAYNQSHNNPIKPRPQSPKPESAKTESPTSKLGQQTKPPAFVGIGAPEQKRTQLPLQSPSPRSPLLQQQPVPAPEQAQSPSPRSPQQQYLVPGLKPAQRPAQQPAQRPLSAPIPQGQRQTKPNPAKTAWNNSQEIEQGHNLQSNDQNGNTNDQSIIKDEMWGNKRQLVPIEPKNSLKQRPVSAPASYFGNKSQTSVSDNQNSPRPIPSTQFSSRPKQNAQNYITSSDSYDFDDDESLYDMKQGVGETAVPIIETTEDKIQNNIKEHFKQFKITLLQIVEAILKTFKEIFKKYSTFFFDNVGKTLIQQDNVQPYAIFYIFLQHMIFKLTQIKNILIPDRQNGKFMISDRQNGKFNYTDEITNLNKQLKQLKLQNDKNNMNSVFADSDEVTSTKKITLDPKFYKYIYEYVESFKLITDDLMTSSIVQKLTLFMGDSKSTESKQLIKAFKEILLQMVSILHEAYTNAFANYDTLLNQMKQNDIPITSKKHTYKIIYLYLFIMQYKFAYVKAQLEMALSSNPGKRSKRVVETVVIDYKKLSDDFLKLFNKPFKKKSYEKIKSNLSKFDLFSV